MQSFHHWSAVFLVEAQALFGRQTLRPRRFVISVNFTQTLQDELALVREVRRDFHKVAAGVRQTMRDNDCQLLGQIARQRVAHLYGRFQARRALLQDVRQILSGMLATGEVQPDPMSFADGYDSAGEHSRPFRGEVRIARRIPIQRQHTHGSVVVVHYFPLRRVADQLIHRGLDLSSGFLYDLALGCRWKRDAQVLLQTLQPIPGEPAAVTQQRDHAGRRVVVLLFAHAFRRRGGKHIPAQIAPQLLQLVHRRGYGRLPFDPHQDAGVALEVDFAALTIRTLVARLQRCVWNLDLARPPICRGAVAPMPRSLTLRTLRRLALLLGSFYACLLQYCLSLFRAGVT